MKLLLFIREIDMRHAALDFGFILSRSCIISLKCEIISLQQVIQTS